MDDSQSAHEIEQTTLESTPTRRLSIVHWIVIAAAAGLLITFGWDGFRVQLAKRQGISDARRDIRNGHLQFRVGGRPSRAFHDTAAVFRERYDADLVRSDSSLVDDTGWHYDSAYNKTMSQALAERSAKFHFNASYQDAAKEGARRAAAGHGQP